MGELITNRSRRTDPNDDPLQYARMIPGTPAVPRSRFAAATPASAAHALSISTAAMSPIGVNNESTIGRAPARTPIPELLLPHPTGDRFVLFQLVAADLIVLVVTSGALSLLSPAWGPPRAYLPVFAVLVTLFGFSEGIYKGGEDPYPAGMTPALARSTLFALGLILVAAAGQMHALAVVATLASSFVSLVLWRRLKQRAWKHSGRDPEPRKVLIVGGGPIARSVAHSLQSDPLQHTTVCGFVDEKLPLSPLVLGRIEDLDWLARAEFIDEIILALPNQPVLTRTAAEVAFRNHLDIRAVPDLPAGLWPDASVDHIGEIPIVTLHREPLPGGALFLKRSMDVVGAAFGLVLISPLLAIVAALIRLDSPGPAVYSAERTGVKGRRFRCHKFRSMVTNAEHLKEELRERNQREGPIFKIDNDPRITRIGRFLRRYSIDELPQLWNVLCGEMSLVGPRPHPVDEVNHYELQHYRRLDVKPGLTGLWQITARDCPSFELNMHLDLTYIENWSLRLDLRILASTLRVLFVPEGA